MKVKLLRQVKGTGKAGEIVEVSPARAAFLLEVSLAEPVLIREQIEAPEKKTAARTTRTAKAETEKTAAKTTAKRTTKK